MRFTQPLGLLLLVLPAVYLAYQRWRFGRPPRAGAAPPRGLWLRCAAFVLLALAVAGPQVPLGRSGASVVFALDRSASIGAADREAARGYLARVAATMGEMDRAAVVVFGREAVVERGLARSLPVADVRSTVAADGTDAAAAMRLAMGLLQGRPRPRIVLISDGNETRGDAVAEARYAAAGGVAVDVLPLVAGGALSGDVAVAAVDSPPRVRIDEPFEIEVALEGPAGAEVEVRLASEAAGDESRTAVLGPRGGGIARFVRRLGGSGMHLFTVEARAAGDPREANNRGGAVIQALDRSSVLYLGDRPADGRLPRILADRGLAVTTGGPDLLPASAAELERFDTVVLDDLPAAALGEARLAALATWVTERGGGLVMLGAAGSFGPGGYGETAVEPILPIELRVRSRREGGDLALVLVLDKSGSMAAGERGPSKLAAAKEAALALLEALDPDDRLGIIAFDREAVAVLAPRAGARPDDVQQLFAGLEAGGGTRAGPALAQAYGWLARTAAARKHVLLLSDGRADRAALSVVRRQAAGSGVELSAVGVGRDVDRAYLAELVAAGGGRLYLADEPRELVDLFRLEGRRLAGEWLVERRFRPRLGDPHEILPAGDAGAGLPEIGGFVASLTREGAATVLLSDEADPILACWRHGLGRVLVFTSDLSSSWTRPLVAWPGFADLWERMVRWTARRLVGETLHPRLAVAGDRLTIRVDAFSGAGSFRNGLDLRARVRLPTGEVPELRLAQVAPGSYEGAIDLAGRGTYLVTVVEEARGGGGESLRLGIHVAALAEDGATAADRPRLAEIARLGGGKVLRPADSPFRPAESPAAHRGVWQVPATAALLLFVAEIGRRRRAIAAAPS